uniref:Uncharacterized protein n=1 Tax=viral metagenome TaxID=1070528 RepID=A0A6C0C6U8_9ZZZZ
MDVTFNYQKFREDKLVGKVTNEIKFYSESEYSEVYPIKEYIDYLKERIGVGQTGTKFYTNYRYQDTNAFKTMEMDEYQKDMEIEIFQRPWKQLKEFHKISKITEYVNKLPYTSKDAAAIEENKQYLIKELCDGLKAKRYAKNKSNIDYDEKGMQIKSISCVEKKKGLYTIEWD